MDSSTFLFGLNDRKFLVQTKKEKTKTFEYDDNTDPFAENCSTTSSENESNSPKKKLQDYFGLDFFQSLEASKEVENKHERNFHETSSDPFAEILRYKKSNEASKTSKAGTFEGLLRSKNQKEEDENEETDLLKEKIKEFLVKKIQAKYCCIFCNTKNEVNFRAGRYSECKNCESRAQLYRRALRLKASKNETFGSDTSHNSRNIPSILLCHTCYLENKPCEVCVKIQSHIQAKKLSKVKEYLCLMCGTNIKERFVEGIYSRCRGCKNELECEKYRSKVSQKKKEIEKSGSENDSRKLIRTIPERVAKIEKVVNSEVEDLKLEILQLKETHHDELSELKTQIKQLKFLISRG